MPYILWMKYSESLIQCLSLSTTSIQIKVGVAISCIFFVHRCIFINVRKCHVVFKLL
jgi:hypothetical protein